MQKVLLGNLENLMIVIGYKVIGWIKEIVVGKYILFMELKVKSISIQLKLLIFIT